MRVLSRLVGNRSVVLAMAFSSVLAMVGCGGNSSSSGSNVTATPTFSPGAGTYRIAQIVTVADTTKGAVLYCTTDGTTPTASSPQCSQPTNVYQTEFLQAIAVAPGKSASAAASAGYTINFNAAPTPTFSPAGATYSAGQQVTISDTLSGANIYYTTDGSMPTMSSTLYTGPITLTKNVTLSAKAFATGYADSGVASAAYTINTNPAAPVISPAGGSFGVAQTVTITDATQGATIYYTVDGTTPTAGSSQYSAPFMASNTEVVSAIAISTGGRSTIATAVFTINLPITAAPTFSPAAGTYTSAQQVVLSSATMSASIYYTTDGSTPTATPSELYSSPVSVATNETINAIAAALGDAPSAVSSAAYTININVPVPTISPATGATLPGNGTVTISDTDANAVMYYTTDGSQPSASSSKYTGPISVTTMGSITINAIAVDTGASSTVATASYTVAADGTPISGVVMSGAHAVNTASVQLYSAGILQSPTPSQPGYGTNATALGSPVTTDSNGKFSITAYVCSASPNDLLYVVASGGDSGNGNNASLQLMAVLGPCGNLSNSSIMVNEVTTVASVMSMAPDNAGNIYVCGDAGGTILDVFNATSALSGIAPTTYQIGSRGCGEQLLLDGQGHLFAISNGFTKAFQDFGTIDEYTTTGAAISPASGYTGTSNAEQPTITQDPNIATGALYFGTQLVATAGAIDGSGNLWLINPDTANGSGMGNSAAGNVLVEFVGLAAPVVTPVSTALANGQLGVRP